MKPLIYIVEDDEGIQEVYEGAFEELYDVKIFDNATDFFHGLSLRKPDLIILDIMLPDTDGYSILTTIRQTDEKLPIIIVSAKSDEISFVKGLNKGADDYMSKPFSVLELLARVKGMLRRANLYVHNTGDFVIDNNVFKIFYKDKDLTLTLKEFKLLRVLLSNSGITLTRDQLFDEVWGENFFGETRALDMHVASLREKLKKITGKDQIITVRGVGYRYENQ